MAFANSTATTFASMLPGQGNLAGPVVMRAVAFSGTDTTVTVTVPGYNVKGALATYITNVADTDAPLSVNVAAGTGVQDNGVLPIDTDGTITVSRPAGTTSGAQFFLLLFVE